MKPEQRKALLIHEANNPDSLYTFNGGESAYGVEHLILNEHYEWEVYQEPKPDIVEYSNDYRSESIWFSTKDAQERHTNSCDAIGHSKRTICGKTGMVKSIELVKD